tara:strand:- start:165 stop:767 length:603 start_codon:yes stop_codon:yes gene_type:complete
MAKLYFYYSAMNAGKTTTLLQSDYNYRERGMETLVFTPAIDDRHAEGIVASRIGLTSNATPFENDFHFYNYIKDKTKTLKNLTCVLVDEAQFMTKDQVAQLCQVSDDLHLPVLCYGLRTNFQGEPFEGSLYLLAWAEELIEIKTICHCGSKATMNLRVDESGHAVYEGAEVEIGGNDRYVAMCRKHYLEAMSGKSATQAA